jgi:hypothetical protein
MENTLIRTEPCPSVRATNALDAERMAPRRPDHERCVPVCEWAHDRSCSDETMPFVRIARYQVGGGRRRRARAVLVYALW